MNNGKTMTDRDKAIQLYMIDMMGSNMRATNKCLQMIIDSRADDLKEVERKRIIKENQEWYETACKQITDMNMAMRAIALGVAHELNESQLEKGRAYIDAVHSTTGLRASE